MLLVRALPFTICPVSLRLSFKRAAVKPSIRSRSCYRRACGACRIFNNPNRFSVDWDSLCSVSHTYLLQHDTIRHQFGVLKSQSHTKNSKTQLFLPVCVSPGYPSSARNNIRSRAWGAAKGGCSIRIERCWVVKSGGGTLDLEPSLSRNLAAAPTLVPAAMERTVTTRSSAQVGVSEW